jgi:hypothetical protein
VARPCCAPTPGPLISSPAVGPRGVRRLPQRHCWRAPWAGSDSSRLWGASRTPQHAERVAGWNGPLPYSWQPEPLPHTSPTTKPRSPHATGTHRGSPENLSPLTAATYRAVTCRPGISGSRGGSIPSCRVWASSARSAPSCDAICNTTTREAMCPASLGLGCIRSAAGNLRAVCRGLGGGEYGEVLAQSGDVQHLVHLR